jgi:phage terminase large subunit
LSILNLPTPRAYVPLLAPARYKGAYGGRGSGKSFFFAEMALERCVAETTRIVCIREVQNSIRDSVRQLLVDKIASLNLSEYFEATREEIRSKNGSLIIFRGMNDANADNIKSLEGYDVAWVEEAQTLSQRSLELLRPTIRKEGSEIWFSWNPRHKSDPVDDFLRTKKPENSAVVRVNHGDNPWFPDTLKAEMAEDCKNDAAKARHIWDGAYEVAPKGSYYGDEIAYLEAENRVTDLLIDPALPVHTAWDLGTARNMTTWLFQISNGQYRFIDFVEYDVPGLAYAVSELNKRQARRKFTWGTHLWPHDGKATEIGGGERRCDTMEKLGFKVECLDRAQDGLGDGIEAVRRLLQMSWFDRDRCRPGLDHLAGYRRKYDKVHDRYIDVPDKNGHDHAADAVRTAAMGKDKLRNEPAAQGWSEKVMKFEFIGAA